MGSILDECYTRLVLEEVLRPGAHIRTIPDRCGYKGVPASIFLITAGGRVVAAVGAAGLAGDVDPPEVFELTPMSHGR